MRWLLLILMLVFVSGCLSGASTKEIEQKTCEQAISELPKIISDAQDSESATVIRVVDGDTVEIDNSNKVRLIGINTPEKKEANYLAAKENMEKLSLNQKVFLEKGVENEDKYGRKLRYIFMENKFVNVEQISAGLASSFEYGSDTKYSFLFNCLETDAKKKGLGIWQGFGKYNFNIEIKQNPDDDKEPNLEYITLTNLGSNVNLKDWKMKDEATHIYTFSDFELENKESVTVYSGKGTNSRNTLYWNLKTTVWNNDHDTVFLRDDEGNLAASYAY